eukprot:CAMPEP_0194328324 /NCGR_PEP_ID=MMETSP0171-20130528/44345_1 /TAXON_ID=218684 /ORGANISM="Corethron pennatum, Strain L29A3" /LENGTH=49 /DNA_ID= /DNA_START= /DNA_END= /DNA_ORIENTATION=
MKTDTGRTPSALPRRAGDATARPVSPTLAHIGRAEGDDDGGARPVRCGR